MSAKAHIPSNTSTNTQVHTPTQTYSPFLLCHIALTELKLGDSLRIKGRLEITKTSIINLTIHVLQTLYCSLVVRRQYYIHLIKTLLPVKSFSVVNIDHVYYSYKMGELH